MPLARIFAAALFNLAGLAFGIAALEAQPSAKPTWWPDRTTDPNPTGLSWPPPKPESWTGPWPPPDWAIGKWIDHFRGADQGGGPGPVDDPDNPSGVGHKGKRDFAFGFKALDSRNRGPCGYFRLSILRESEVDSCTPFPVSEAKTLCRQARDVNQARRDCARSCRTRRTCRNSQLARRPALVSWLCELTLPPPSPLEGTELGGPASSNFVSCVGTYICQCKP